MVLEFELPGKDLPDDDDDSEPVEKVVKKKNPMKVKVKNTEVISAKTLKKTSYQIKKVYTVKNAVGRVSSPSVKMSKGMGSMATVYTNGDINLRSGNYKKRVYKFILKIKAEGNDEYKPKTLYVTFRVKIK